MIFVLTGESGSGKTTLCTRAVASLKARGLDVAGVLTLPRMVNGVKVELELEDARAGTRWMLAEHTVKGQGTADLAWKFDPAALQQGAQILRNATPCEVLVIDELGPLELVHGQGWIIAMEVLSSANYHHALVVVRPELVEVFRVQAKLVIQVVMVTQANREELAKRLVDILDPQIHKEKI